MTGSPVTLTGPSHVTSGHKMYSVRRSHLQTIFIFLTLTGGELLMMVRTTPPRLMMLLTRYWLRSESFTVGLCK